MAKTLSIANVAEQALTMQRSVATLTPTSHAALRMAQRGIHPGDWELIALIGTEIEGGYLVRRRDYQEIERALKI